MSNEAIPGVDFGPLGGLVGTWQGDKGMDVAPEADGQQDTPYFETLTFDAVGDVCNAGKQTLAVIRYHQVVSRKADQEVFHDETGYWMWDAANNTIMHSLAIPRAVCLLAGGRYTAPASDNDNLVLEVQAGIDDPDWAIVQSPFMRDNANTVAFTHRMELGRDTLNYSETTTLDIYGRRFSHTDANTLLRAGA